MVEHSWPPELDRVFSALADPTRRAILRALTERSSTITEIAKPFPVSFNAISKHVMVLERAGLVHREIKGRERYCWIDPDPLQEARLWLEHYRRLKDGERSQKHSLPIGRAAIQSRTPED